jgi:hypothetical protein
MKDNRFRKENYCPYCGYLCDASTLLFKKNGKPKPGDLSFCIMCTEPSEFDKKLNLIKFDLNSIEDAIERNRLKGIQVQMLLYWEANPDPRRDKIIGNL